MTGTNFPNVLSHYFRLLINARELQCNRAPGARREREPPKVKYPHPGHILGLSLIDCDCSDGYQVELYGDFWFKIHKSAGFMLTAISFQSETI